MKKLFNYLLLCILFVCPFAMAQSYLCPSLVTIKNGVLGNQPFPPGFYYISGTKADGNYNFAGAQAYSQFAPLWVTCKYRDPATKLEFTYQGDNYGPVTGVPISYWIFSAGLWSCGGDAINCQVYSS